MTVVVLDSRHSLLNIFNVESLAVPLFKLPAAVTALLPTLLWPSTEPSPFSSEMVTTILGITPQPGATSPGRSRREKTEPAPLSTIPHGVETRLVSMFSQHPSSAAFPPGYTIPAAQLPDN